MRLVISDTTPINYLVLIGHIGILPLLFEKILIPFAVQNELKDLDAPPEVRKWIAHPPDWLETREVSAHLSNDESIRFLDEGEKEAISLAVALHADTLLLMDDRAAVTAARRKGLAVTGTIGILEEAAKHDLLDLADAFTRLRRTTFHCSEDLLQKVLANQRSKGKP